MMGRFRITLRETHTDDEIAEACKNAWHFLVNDPDRIRSIG